MDDTPASVRPRAAATGPATVDGASKPVTRQRRALLTANKMRRRKQTTTASERESSAAWSDDYAARCDDERARATVNPFGDAQLAVDSTPAALAWTRAAADVAQPRLQVIVKEEFSKAADEATARPRLVLKFKSLSAAAADDDDDSPPPPQKKRRHRHHHKRRRDEAKPADAADSELLLDDALRRRFEAFEWTPRTNVEKGTFLLAKADAWRPQPTLWRIDSQGLLRKFESCDGDAANAELSGCFRNTPTYRGWCDSMATKFVIVKVEFLKRSRAETIVRPLHSLQSLLPAIDAELVATQPEHLDDIERSTNVKLATPTTSDDSFDGVIEQTLDAILRHCLGTQNLANVEPGEQTLNDR